MRATSIDSLIAYMTFGELSMRWPRNLMAAISDAAMSSAPFWRSSTFTRSSDMANPLLAYSVFFAKRTDRGAKERQLLFACGPRAAQTEFGKGLALRCVWQESGL